MDRPNKCTRRLFSLTDEAESNLLLASQTMRLSHSLTVREALRCYVERIKANGHHPGVAEARLDGLLVNLETNQEKESPTAGTEGEEQEIKSMSGGEIPH